MFHVSVEKQFIAVFLKEIRPLRGTTELWQVLGEFSISLLFTCILVNKKLVLIVKLCKLQVCSIGSWIQCFFARPQHRSLCLMTETEHTPGVSSSKESHTLYNKIILYFLSPLIICKALSPNAIF